MIAGLNIGRTTRQAAWVLVGVLLAAAFVLRAQQASSSSLVLRVEEKSSVTPGAASLQFVIPADNSQPAPKILAISAWVRARRGQHIVVVAKPAGNLIGSAGEIPVSAVQFAGTTVQALYGAEVASCTRGALGATSVELVAGWLTSGILTCQVTFSLAGREGLKPGVYSTELTFSVTAQ